MSFNLQKASKRPNPSEVSIENRCVRYAKKEGWFVAKLKFLSWRGAPDRMFIRFGVVVFVEFKKPGGTPSKNQERFAATMKGHGIKVYYCDNFEDFKEILDNA